MFWALIVSIILKSYIKQTNHITKFDNDTGHTPGFYEVESIRYQQYLMAMNKKLASAMESHKRASNTMFRTARKNKPSAIQNRAFFRLIAADNRVLRAHKLVTNVAEDLSVVNVTKSDMNEFVNIAYDLAYKTKIDLLKYRLSQVRTK